MPGNLTPKFRKSRKEKKLKPELVEQITDYLLIETELEKADLGFVFGNRHSLPCADRAAELYHKGYFRKMIVSGGVPRDGADSEAELIHQRLVELGVPEDAIIVERGATNTGENVQLALPLLEQEMGLENIKSVIAIGRVEASRRYLMTMERHWPGLKLMISPVNLHPVPKERWPENISFRAKVLAEWNKLPGYFKLGFITEVQLDNIIPSRKTAINDNRERKRPKRRQPGLRQ